MMNNLWKKKTGTGLKPAPPRIRKEIIPDAPKAKPLPSKEKEVRARDLAARLRQEQLRSSSKSGQTRTKLSATPSKNNGLRPTKRKASRQPSPSNPFSHDDDSSDEDGSGSSPVSCEKRQRKDLWDGPEDLNRRICHHKSFSSEVYNVKMIHAADVQMDDHKAKSANAQVDEKVTVELQYPSSSQRERYELVLARDAIDPFEEILEIAKLVTQVYLSEEQAEPFTNPISGHIRTIEKAKNTKDQAGFITAVESYNCAISGLVKDGVLAKNLEAMHHVPFDLVRRILSQGYDRTVSPKVDSLRKYENGTDEVYGELLPPLIHKLLSEVQLKSDQVFIDLGSGVGNVVFQAALEFGCESWGCEMMQNAYELADAQKREFRARCRLWGVAPGQVHLEKGSFLENKPIYEAMKRADVILINNHVFTPQTNRSLVDMFLDLKDDCKIISMKNFVPDDHVAKRNANDPVNILDVITKGTYYSGSVSWTSDPGKYYIARKRSMIEVYS